jgi:hypothetical protein
VTTADHGTRSIVVTSLGDLIDKVTPGSPDPKTGRWRDTGVYRGAFDTARPLLTSLDRLGGTSPPHTKAGLEEHVLRNFIRYSRPYLPAAAATDWELLVTAQHHGVPTRLLDWTYSPLIAAYFATRPTRREAHHDHAVWRLDWKRMHEAFGFPGLALLIQDVEQLGGEEGPFTPWELFSRSSDAKPFACMIEPPSLDARIVAQAAVFTLCSDKSQPFDAFLATHGLADALTRFVIPKEAVPRFRDQLDLVSVDERRLFPDLDGVSAAIKHYDA